MELLCARDPRGEAGGSLGGWGGVSTLTSLYEAKGEGPSLAGCWPETSSLLHFMVSLSKEGPGPPGEGASPVGSWTRQAGASFRLCPIPPGMESARGGGSVVAGGASLELLPSSAPRLLTLPPAGKEASSLPYAEVGAQVALGRPQVSHPFSAPSPRPAPLWTLPAALRLTGTGSCCSVRGGSVPSSLLSLHATPVTPLGPSGSWNFSVLSHVCDGPSLKAFLPNVSR